EIGSEADAKAVESGVHAGVRLIVSIHAQSKEELLRRPQAKLLLQTGAFEKLVLLAGKKQPGKVSAIYDCNSLF
ncbi:MAG: stage III sporulation protein AA, partial [Pygmaiobacter massiliensis]|nr:stage III sporulation protein AA [Pygmaiobacter massiliensis]